MGTHSFYGYAANALVINPQSGDAALKSGYTHANDRTRLEITDTDSFADGDATNDEVGDDSNQIGNVYESNGALIASGRIYVEEVRWYQSASGEMISVNVFEIGGQVVGYVPSAPLTKGESYSYVGSSEPGEKIGGNNNNASLNTYTHYEKSSVVCFGPGTIITTDGGDIPVEWLATCDRVLTRDHGFQPILWLGRTTLPAGYFTMYPDHAPVRLPAGVLGPGCPARDLHLTGDHRVLLRSVEAELSFVSGEVLAPAKAWVDAGLAGTLRLSGSYTLTHIVCAAHQIIVAEGAWVETMFTGEEALRRLPREDVERLENLLGADMRRGVTARPCVSRREAAFLLRRAGMVLGEVRQSA